MANISASARYTLVLAVSCDDTYELYWKASFPCTGASKSLGPQGHA